MAYLTFPQSDAILLPVTPLVPMGQGGASAPPDNLYLVNGVLKAGSSAPANGRLVAYFPATEGLEATPVEAAGSSTTDGTTGSAPSVQVTASFAGAVGGATYAWTRVDSGGTDFLIDNAALAAPTFSVASGTTAYDVTQFWRCEATTATQSDSVIVKVRLQRSVVEPPPAGGAYRFWRIEITNNGGSAYTSIAELQLRLTAGGADQTSPSGTTAASTSYFSENGARAFDDYNVDANTWVSTNSGLPQWVQYDFGAGNAKEIKEIAMWPESTESTTRAPTAFTVKASNDGSAWTTIKSFSSFGSWTYLTAKTFWLGGFSAVASPATSEEGGNRGDTLNDAITCVPDGVGPFTYLWSKFSGLANFTLTNATSATCNLSSSTTPGTSDIERTGVLRCVVTDTGASGVTYTVDVPVDWLWAGSA